MEEKDGRGVEKEMGDRGGKGEGEGEREGTTVEDGRPVQCILTFFPAQVQSLRIKQHYYLTAFFFSSSVSTFHCSAAYSEKKKRFEVCY